MTEKMISAGHSYLQASQMIGLPGGVRRSIKLTLLGAGSASPPRLLNDVLRIPGERGGMIALVDIDRNRLRTMHLLVEKLIAKLQQAVNIYQKNRHLNTKQWPVQ